MEEAVLLVDNSHPAIAILTLNRPDQRNALNIELMEALRLQLESLATDARRRVVILRGAGPAFCAGLDLLQAAKSDEMQASARCVAALLRTVATSPLISIAAAHGAAYAGGAGLMSACDFAVASDDLRICFPEVRRGLVPALVSVVLRDRVGDAQLRELLLLGEPVDAWQAQRSGLVHRVVPGNATLAEAWQLADTILKGAPEAVRQTKRLLTDIRDASRDELGQRALEYHAQARESHEAREGLQAFRQRRDPIW